VGDNTVNGKPLACLEDVSNYKVEDAGQVILVNCTNITIVNLDLSNTSIGIELLNTKDSKVLNNTACNNIYGISLSSPLLSSPLLSSPLISSPLPATTALQAILSATTPVTINLFLVMPRASPSWVPATTPLGAIVSATTMKASTSVVSTPHIPAATKSISTFS
jgi:parallel beta-helix repeat protein